MLSQCQLHISGCAEKNEEDVVIAQYDLLLLVINNDSSKVRKHGETYEVAGVRFTADQIPKIAITKIRAMHKNKERYDGD